MSSNRQERKQLVKNVSKEQWDAIRTHEDEVYRTGGFEKNLVPYWVRYVNEHPADFFL